MANLCLSQVYLDKNSVTIYISFPAKGCFTIINIVPDNELWDSVCTLQKVKLIVHVCLVQLVAQKLQTLPLSEVRVHEIYLVT